MDLDVELITHGKIAQRRVAELRKAVDWFFGLGLAAECFKSYNRLVINYCSTRNRLRESFSEWYDDDNAAALEEMQGYARSDRWYAEIGLLRCPEELRVLFHELTHIPLESPILREAFIRHNEDVFNGEPLPVWVDGHEIDEAVYWKVENYEDEVICEIEAARLYREFRGLPTAVPFQRGTTG